MSFKYKGLWYFISLGLLIAYSVMTCVMKRIESSYTSKSLIFISGVACNPMRHVSYLATLLVQGNSAVRPLGHDLFLLKLGLPRLHCHKHTIPPKYNCQLECSSSSGLILNIDSSGRMTSLVHNSWWFVGKLICSFLTFNGFLSDMNNIEFR